MADLGSAPPAVSVETACSEKLETSPMFSSMVAHCVGPLMSVEQPSPESEEVVGKAKDSVPSQIGSVANGADLSTSMVAHCEGPLVVREALGFV